MTREERIEKLRHLITCMKCEVSGKPCNNNCSTQYNAGNVGEIIENLEEIVKVLEQEPCDMTAEEYRQRMIQAFHNADCDELIAICVLPTEKEFEHLEWLLKNHYKKEPCDDCISRQVALDTFGLSEKSRKYGGDHSGYDTIMLYEVQDALEALPSVQPKQKTGYFEWKSDGFPEFGNWHCSECQLIVIYHVKKDDKCGIPWFNYCPNCGAKMEGGENDTQRQH